MPCAKRWGKNKGPGRLQFELSRLRGESGRLTAAIAETEGKISETRLQALQVDEDMRKDVNEELRELDGKEVELVERKAVAKDQLARTEIRAPQAGFVQELAVHTVGGVISPGETIMLIVPEQDRL
ncbi:MAG: HlyD family efflux transporter periplasmic adaptor subunit, partial [Mesorhizobium sp.]